jgi:hypothetical protein
MDPPGVSDNIRDVKVQISIIYLQFYKKFLVWNL